MKASYNQREWCVLLYVLCPKSRVRIRFFVRWWRDVQFTTSTVSIDDSSETDWRWKFVGFSEMVMHTHRERDRQWYQPTSQPTVRPTDRFDIIRVILFPLSSLEFLFCSSLSLAINVCIFVLCTQEPKSVEKKIVTVPSTFEWMVHMNRYNSKLFWIRTFGFGRSVFW